MTRNKIAIILVTLILLAGILLTLTDIISEKIAIKAFMVPAFVILSIQLKAILKEKTI